MLVYDPDVNPHEMLGSNLAYLERQLPQINKILCCRVEELVNQSEVIVISPKRPEFLDVLKKISRPIVALDLVRLSHHPETLGLVQYRGISW